jgi:hypothetical protein
MKNFGIMVKMMVVAVMMSAFFCSCSVASGASYDSYSEAKATSVETDYSGLAGQGSGLNIHVANIAIEVQTEDNRTEVSCGETLQINCFEAEGSDTIGLCEWYVTGVKVAEGTSFEFAQDRAGVYNVSCIAVDDANNPKLADCVQLSITVR